MPERITPSEKQRTSVYPQTDFHKSREGETISPVMYWTKTIFGTPVPYFLLLYVVSLLTSMTGMEIFSWSTMLFTLIYILVDRVSRHKEFRFYRLGVEIPLIGLLLIALAGLLINHASHDDLIFGMGKLRWVVLLYTFVYALELFPGLNRLLNIILILSVPVAGYAIFEHFTGIDLVRGDHRAVTPAPFDEGFFQSVGFFSHHLTYGYSFAMMICFPVAALLLSKEKPFWFRLLFLIPIVTIGMSLVWTYGRGVWLAAGAAMIVMAAYTSRKYFFNLILIGGIVAAVIYSGSSGIQQKALSTFDNKFWSNTDRQDLWRANVEMFKENPWVGVGYTLNEDLADEYCKKLGITDACGGHAHNNYLQMLSTTGLFGFICYMLFILSFLLMTNKLWSDIPETHFWHRVIALGALGSQISMHVGGMTQWNFGDAEVNHPFIFILAVVAYMAEHYSHGIVPDDHAL